MAISKDLKQDEIDLREDPQKLFNRLSASITVPSSPLASTNALVFEAREQGLSQLEYTELLTLLARADLQPNVTNPNKRNSVDVIVKTLEATASTPYQKAMAVMLKGRAMARLDQKFDDAAGLFIQALTTDQESQSLESQILRLNLHEQLGGMYLMINQDVTALIHLQKYRDLAYQLRNDYLIASSEAELGKYYTKKAEHTKALQHYSEALRLSDKDEHPFQHAFLQMQLARVYRELGQIADALAHAHDAADAYGKLGVDGYLSTTLTVIAVIHAQNNEWNKAIDYYLNAQQLDRRSGNFTALARNFHNLGEAYGMIGDNELALNYLKQANSMFIERKMKHYQVNNDQLLAQTHCKMQHWVECQRHADITITLATEQALDDVLIDAYKQKLLAANATGNKDAAISYQAQIISLLGKVQQIPQQAGSASALTEQKLKLDLHQKAAQLEESNEQLRHRTLLTAALVVLALVLSMSLVHARNGRGQARTRIKELEQQLPREPLTGHPGFTAFTGAIASPATKALGLLRLSSDNEADIALGHKRMAARVSSSVQAIQKLPGINAYVLRPGLLALTFDGPIKDAAAVLFNLRNQLGDTGGPLQFSYVNLPLLPNPELSIQAGVHLEVVQLALAGACSLKADQDVYVGFWALDFTPSAIFSHPVYLHLEKSIGRGLIRIETNADKDKIRWPAWEFDGTDENYANPV
ncbi:tetratricopeptide repeat protein [Shewanella sp. JM162201]|uniref:Tetratricopeptide repeat protein n=1 Tax=Shewanella jiangmenensis TaxID=2837387 RepID=A0ABS5UYP1_9GAMM|nr:tetratricopeptide repeat protein [Shewanella jiangmenensis]MBT1443235.1 tetratricopeptide repeat protein [Shewanella jiangmenensis]